MNPGALLPYWPTPANVAACIKQEAETLNEVVFLAVHQPMEFRRQQVGASGQGDVVTEEALLTAFLRPDPPSGNLIVPIYGSSGVGKSHVIRWLDAQLRRRSDRDRRHVIRIPKGFSLKRVLWRILEGLEGTGYARVRDALQSAHEGLSAEQAALQLSLNLGRHISERGTEASARIQTGTSTSLPSDRECAALCGKGLGSQGLPTLLGDPMLQADHFIGNKANKGIVTRIAEHVTQEGSSDDDERVHEFTEKDLEIPQEILARANDGARNFVMRSLTGESEPRVKARQTSARFLNEALDGAKRDLLKLGDNTMPELFEEIRRELLKEGRELVLLVEDLAAIAGLQRALLDVMIREADPDGEQRLCVMRSALACTSGYSDTMRTTFRTRAGAEWTIEDAPGTEEQIIERAIDLVGSYLNAARVGQAELKEHSAALDAGKASRAWIPAFSSALAPDEERVLEVFGKTRRGGYSLFPFNPSAIARMAREQSVNSAGRMVFNPRLLINNVVHDTLQHREIFARGEFPHDAFRSPPTRATDFFDQLKLRWGMDPSQWKRYRQVFEYWGGEPNTLEDVWELGAGLFQAFSLPTGPAPTPRGLPPVVENASLRPRPPSPHPAPDAPAVTARRPLPADLPPPNAPVGELPLEVPAEVTRWEEIISRWQQGTALGQADARRLRKVITHALLNYVEWNWHHIKHRWKDENLVSLPNAVGEGNSASKSVILIATEKEWKDADEAEPTKNALLALIRFVAYGNTWDYPGGELGCAYAAEFLQRHAASALEVVRKRPFLVDADVRPALVQGLLVGARALGVAEVSSARPKIVEALGALFSPSPSLATASTDGASSRASTVGDSGEVIRNWERITGRFRALRSTTEGASWASLLLELVGARQGPGKTVYALDVAQLMPFVEATLKSWELTETLPPSTNTAEKLDYGRLAKDYGELKLLLPRAIVEECRDLTQWERDLRGWLGPTFNQEQVLDLLQQTLNAVKSLGRTTSLRVPPIELERRIATMRRWPIKPALDAAAVVGGAKVSRAQQLAVLAANHDGVVRASRALRDGFEDLLVAGEAEFLGGVGVPDPVEDARKAMVAVVGALAELVDQFPKVSK